MSTPRTCEAATCDRPAADGWGICRGCHRRTRMHLVSLAGDLSAELETTLTGQGKMGPDRVGGRSSTVPLPFDERASAVLVDVHARLVGWCRLLHDESGAPLPADTIHAMTLHLIRWLDVLAKHEIVGEFVDEVQSCVVAIERAIDLPPIRARLHVGRCPNVIDTTTLDPTPEPCPGDMWARFPRDEILPPMIACDYCAGAYEPGHWQRLGERMGRRDRDARGYDLLRRAIFGEGA